ncbi:MAG TPA: chromosome segregation protein SMC [Coxiellaceae bacterium]|nr:MAG: chromosome segregation protein SMC [Gammaproteobacteria bacterium RIFCSPHIGHO2_12_FULL_36_30]HLB56907.1 chromosome segregation protein SMC [Coxiellaceae bacterium]
MQLKRIQLFGFKSFVDPTSIPVTSHMNAIVGPNGCGKSNIVDAIRWVTGEMSAKQLRGQSMSDVIFNGSTGRKPVGKAAVELTFDNSDRRITGEYAAFSEISIRREVVREGQSNYFINGVAARRRDLVDLFLGTGLGPRSYAIIEQGMIAQLVEAKPEELRAHFEEVASISKYRERRRETETRIRHTQENCDRLNDVCAELAKQLRHLERQSEAAEKYKILQQELRLLHAQMKALQWTAFEKQSHDKKEKIAQIVLQHEAQLATQRECEMNIEKSRIDIQTFLDEKEGVQKQFYGLGSEIARLEQQIQHKQEQSKQWEREITESASLFDELTHQATAQTEQIEILTEELTQLKPQSGQLHEVLQAANKTLQIAEQNMRQAQNECDRFQEKISATHQQLEVAKNNCSHYEKQQQQLQERRTQLQTQLSALPTNNSSDEINPLSEKVQTLQKKISDIQATLSQLSKSIQAQRNTQLNLQTAFSKQQGELQKCEAQVASLNALQQDNQEEVKAWLKQHDLSKQTKLGKMIHVDAGWELAVETVLGNHVDAICVDSIDEMKNALKDFSKGEMTLCESGSGSGNRRTSILSVIKNSNKLPAWLSCVYIADDLSEALKSKSTLQSHESVITRDGYWIGNNWLTISKSHTEEDSFLVREKKLKELALLIQDYTENFSTLQTQLADAKSTLEKLESTRDAQHQLFQETSQALTETQTKLSEKKSRLEASTQQQNHLTSEIKQIESQLKQCESTMQTAQQAITHFTKTVQTESAQKENIIAERAKAENVLNAARLEAQTKKQHADEWHIKLSSTEKQLSVLTQSLNANQKQLLQLTERRNTIQKQLSEVHVPLKEWSDALQKNLNNRTVVENNLRGIDQRLQSEQNHLKQIETARDRAIQMLSSLQEQQQQLRMDNQETLVRQTTLKEQIVEMKFNIETLLSEMPENAELSEWEENVNTVQARIDRLGPINLAAIDEYKELSERKVYMDQQVADLLAALEILQNAIRKIDRETKHLFQNTFDTVNQHFQKLFPRIFNGGSAELSLTDDDLLTTGIIVKAQPPGKRNSSIHMLSGGEKTLTAIALMFAIFHLNPAPFCVLDEVDAPLDDLNVGRYCQLVKEMSKDTQFLIISHNKVTIEAADHLMGVTMQEPGVSRIVSVDIQEAVEMVEA